MKVIRVEHLHFVEHNKLLTTHLPHSLVLMGPKVRSQQPRTMCRAGSSIWTICLLVELRREDFAGMHEALAIHKDHIYVHDHLMQLTM